MSLVNNNVMQSPIASWFAGRSILVTGGTGFMGKALVEKLLRSCPGIKTIYVLIRPKRGQEAKQRIETLISQPLFDQIRRTKPEVLNKLIPVPGDITQEGLGITKNDRQALIEHVSVVFHSAATVKFDEALRLSVEMNISGTNELVELCKNFVNLEALVHVSTAYCNCDREYIDEIVYPPPGDPQKIIKCVQCLNDDILSDLTPKLLGDRPNTYTYTKALAEHVIAENSGKLPVAIVRPSIVTPAVEEPAPGWVDNLNGPTGLCIGAGKGILRTVLCYRHMKADIIPVDIAINLLITVAWHTATSKPNSIEIYNCTSGRLNPFLWGDFERLMAANIKKYPFNEILWYPGGSFKSSPIINNICVTLFHLFPAYLIDFVSILTGKKPIMVKIQQKIQKAVKSLEFFTTHEWEFRNENVEKLYLSLDENDKMLFNFDIKTVEWEQYIETYLIGTKKFVLKEDPKTFPAAQKNLKKMYYIHRTTQVILLYILWRLTLSQSTMARSLAHTGVNYFVNFLTSCKNFILSR